MLIGELRRVEVAVDSLPDVQVAAEAERAERPGIEPGAPDPDSRDDVRAETLAAPEELAADLQQWVKQRFAAHAYPRAIHFVDAMPKTPSGKIQRFVLKQWRIDELDGVQ